MVQLNPWREKSRLYVDLLDNSWVWLDKELADAKAVLDSAEVRLEVQQGGSLVARDQTGTLTIRISSQRAKDAEEEGRNRITERLLPAHSLTVPPDQPRSVNEMTTG